MELGGLLLKIKQGLVKNEHKIVLVVGFCLVSAISFGFGTLWGQKWHQKPLVIEKQVTIAQNAENSPEAQNEAQMSTQPIVPAASAVAGAEQKKNCAFVGSKNSDKFYVPTCSWAKRIKPENLVCYPDEQAALVKGKVKSDCK